MSDKLSRAAEVWRKMQGDPEMVGGLTVGDIEDLAEGIGELLAVQYEVRRSVPLALMFELGQATEDARTQADRMTAFLKLPLLRKALDALAGDTPR